MTVRFLKTAQKELNDTFDWYEEQLNDLGYEFLKEIHNAIGRISAWPSTHARMGYGLHRCLVKRFPFGIIYGTESDEIIVVAVAHLHRKPYYWIERI